MSDKAPWAERYGARRPIARWRLRTHNHTYEPAFDLG